MVLTSRLFFFFFFNDTATTEIYTLSLHDALPISRSLPVLPAVAGFPVRLAVVQGGQPEFPGQGGGVGVGDELEVVDAGRLRGRRVVLVGRGLGVGVPADDLRDRPADLPALPVDGQLRHVERVLCAAPDYVSSGVRRDVLPAHRD